MVSAVEVGKERSRSCDPYDWFMGCICMNGCLLGICCNVGWLSSLVCLLIQSFLNRPMYAFLNSTLLQINVDRLCQQNHKKTTMKYVEINNILWKYNGIIPKATWTIE